MAHVYILLLLQHTRHIEGSSVRLMLVHSEAELWRGGPTQVRIRDILPSVLTNTITLNVYLH